MQRSKSRQFFFNLRTSLYVKKFTTKTLFFRTKLILERILKKNFYYLGYFKSIVGIRRNTLIYIGSVLKLVEYLFHAHWMKKAPLIMVFNAFLSSIDPLRKVTLTRSRYAVEFSHNTQSWQCWHFHTTSGNKSETVKNRISFSVNLHLSLCLNPNSQSNLFSNVSKTKISITLLTLCITGKLGSN